MADRINLLKDIQKGMSPTYLGPFNKISGLDIDTVPGVVFPEYRLRQEYPYANTDTNLARTFTAATSDTCTATSGPGVLGYWGVGQSVTVSSAGTLPAGLSANTTYYAFGFGSQTFKLADSIANLYNEVAVNITDTGTGVHTITPIAMEKLRTIIQSGSNKYAVDDNNGTIWFSGAAYGDTWLAIKGKTGPFYQIALYKNYLLAFGGAVGSNVVEVWGEADDPLTATWKTWDGDDPLLSVGGSRVSTVEMSNGILYVGNSNFIDSLMETPGDTFDPASAASFTWSKNALDLPEEQVVSSLCEYNYSLAVGTGLGDEYHAKIYFWDTFSPSFDVVLEAESSWVQNMISYNGLLYFTVGDANYASNGTIYVTNGSSAKKAYTIPKPSNASQQVRSSYPYKINAKSMVEWNGKLLIGVSGQYGAGIYAINPDTGSIVQIYTDSTGTEGVPGQGADAITVNFYAILPTEKNVTVGTLRETYDGSFYAVQTLNNDDTSTPYRVNTDSYFETGLMTVGTKYQPNTFRFIEVQLGKPLATGEVITLQFRKSMTDSYTTIGTLSYATDGAVYSKIIENSAVFADQIQFKCLFTVGSSATTGPELKAIYLN